MQNDPLLHKWLNDELTPAEKAAFEQRPEAADLERLRRITDQMQPPIFRADETLNKVLHAPKHALQVRQRWWFAAAAAVALMLTVWVAWPSAEGPLRYATLSGEQQQVELPDDSQVILGVASTLEYREGAERQVDLSGEAYFEVQEGKPFVVAVPRGQVQVLGTRFNVAARDGWLEVSCYAGSVMVEWFTSKMRDTLQAGEAVRYATTAAPQAWKLSSETTQPTWLTGNTQLQSVALLRALRELQRQYDISFEWGDDVNVAQTVTVNFPNDNLDVALAAVLIPFNIRHEKIANGAYRLEALDQ